MKYRKKPVDVDAIQYWDGDDEKESTLCECFDFCEGTGIGKDSEGNPYLLISTLEGVMRAYSGDWIVKGVAGEFYPCKNDIFEKTYEKVEEI